MVDKMGNAFKKFLCILLALIQCLYNLPLNALNDLAIKKVVSPYQHSLNLSNESLGYAGPIINRNKLQ